MIKNERQYRITKAQADEFTRALRALDSTGNERREIHPLLLNAQRDALRSQLNDLESDLREYETLRQGEFEFKQLDTIADLPRLLISARIASGLTQRDLAQRLGLKEQQIQRYEATEYESASLARIKEVVAALDIDVDESAITEWGGDSLRDVLIRLKSVGLPPEFVGKRLIPRWAMSFTQSTNLDGEDDMRSRLAIETIGKIFNWSPEQILGREPLGLQHTSGGVRFKVAAGAHPERVSAYAAYAHYLSLVVAQTCSVAIKPIPRDPWEIIASIESNYGHVDLNSIANYAWDLGIPVLALDDPGAFHGACFREGGRNMIVLKQKTRSYARWAFDLLHELWHAAQEPELPERTVIELDEMAIERRQSDEEILAGHFAAAVLLRGRGPELAEQCLALADRNLRRLRTAVQRTAERTEVSVDVLANYLAFRLAAEQGENWWATAANLQSVGDPWADVRNVFVERADFTSLSEFDRGFLVQALARWEEVSYE